MKKNEKIRHAGNTKTKSEYNIYRKDFPILNNKQSNTSNYLSYLDNAATTQKPQAVINKLKDFYERYNANTHRGVYSLSENATLMLEDSRKTFAKFINSEPEEIIFVRSATEGINQIAISIERSFELDNKHNIVVPIIEHHSNFVPWQQLCKRNSMGFRTVPYNANNDSLDDISRYIDENAVLVSFTGMSNVTGMILDVKKIISDIRKKNKNCIIVLDATQLIAHRRVDVKYLDVDFLCFSAHKIYGTTGVGIVYGKKKYLENIEPFFYGGNMINDVSIEESSWAEIPDKFEAGTIDTAGIVASAEAIRYLQKDFDRFMKIEDDLKDYALKRLKTIKGLKIIGHDSKDYGPVISFTLDSIHPHDLATIADKHGVCLRAGHHCAKPFMRSLGTLATSRISIAFYNTKEDIDKTIDAILYAQKILVK